MNRSPRRTPRPPRASKGGPGLTKSANRFPLISALLMAVFVVGGSLVLLAPWPDGPLNLDWGVWILVYGGYPYVVCAALVHARRGG